MRFRIFLAFLLLFIANTIYSQNQKITYRIVSISVEGNVTADASVIIATSGLRTGMEVEIPGDELNNAIKRLWSLNIFSDIQIEKEKQIGRDIYILIKVKESPKLDQYVLSGYDDISESEINKRLTLSKGQVLKPQDLSKVKRIIKSLYQDEGYLNAVVEPQIFNFYSADTVKKEVRITWVNSNDPDDKYQTKFDLDDKTESVKRSMSRVLLKIKIEEGNKVKVKKIEFFGNNSFDDGDLASEFNDTKESKWWKFWTSATFDKKKFEKDKDLLIKFYRKNGFRYATIEADSLEFDEEKKYVTIKIYLDEGKQFKLRNIVWKGNKTYRDEVLNARLGFQKGDVYDYEKFEKNLRSNETQTDVSSLYYDNGYLAFSLKTEEIRVGEDSVDVIITVQERNKFRVGFVEISGNDKTKDKVIRRELFTRPGDYFNRTLLFRSLQQLANLQYFNVEKLYQEGMDYFISSDSTVDISYKVEEKSSDYLNASVGYSGSFGLSGAVGITLTNFSITEPFSLGGGQILSFNWQFGVANYYRTFSLGFTEPWFLDTPTLIGFDIFDTRQIYIYDLNQYGGSFRVGRRLKWPDDYFSVMGTVRFQYNDVKGGGGYYREGKTKQFTVGLNLSRKDLDNPIFPSQGSYININTDLSGGPFLPGDVDFLKVDFNMDWYRRLFNSNKFTLYFNTNIGVLKELREGTLIQPFEYYYMGGNGLIIATAPLRGYDDRTVGPKNAVGQVIGGKISYRSTIELRFAVTLEPMPLYLLAFAEAGNVWKETSNFNLFDLRRSVGFGARVLINPIGLIGFDMGYGFDKMKVDGTKPTWMFHFQFGKNL